jgi:hypothetical protein
LKPPIKGKRKILYVLMAVDCVGPEACGYVEKNWWYYNQEASLGDARERWCQTEGKTDQKLKGISACEMAVERDGCDRKHSPNSPKQSLLCS